MRPPGYPHSSAFQEAAETVAHGLRRLGCEVELQENQFDTEATNVFFGAHLLPKWFTFPPSTILYNSEHIHPDAMRNNGVVLDVYRPHNVYRPHKVWDYSAQNVERLRKAGVAAQHVPIGYAPEMTRIQPAAEQDIDVLFYGSVNERRQRLFEQIRGLGLNLVTLFGVYGAERDAAIARSKAVLNAHFYDEQPFETFRVGYLLANRVPVISETCQSIDLGLEGAAHFAPYEEIPSACRALVRDEAARLDRAMRGYVAFTARLEAGILRTAIEGACG